MLTAQSIETIPAITGGEKGLLRRIVISLQEIQENQREQLFLWSPVLFAAGIGLYFSLSFEPPLTYAVIPALLFLSICLLPYGFISRNVSAFFSFARLICIMAVGFTCAKVHTVLIEAPILEREINFAEIEGTIETLEYLSGGKGSRAILSDLNIEKLDRDKTPYKIRLQIRKDEGLQVGQRIKALARISPPSDALIPGGYDFRRAMFFSQIGAVGFAFKQPEIIRENPAIPTIEGIRRKIAGLIETSLPEREAGIASALMIGQKKGISEEDDTALRDAGLAHLLAISGLHVSLIAGSVFFMVRMLMALYPPLALRCPIKKLSAVISLIAAFLFMLVAGATIPTQRAVLMISIVFLGVIMDRVAISMRLLAFAALVVMFLAPESLLSPSFQMSFAAVAGLIAAYEACKNYGVNFYALNKPHMRAALYFVGICFSSIIASAATAPLSAYHFQQVAAYGLISNLVAIPLMAFLIMPAALFAFILMPLGLAYWPLKLMALGIAAIIETAYWTSALPGAVWVTPGWPLSALIMIVLSGLILILWQGRGRVVGIIPLLLSAVLIYRAPLPDILIASEGELAAIRNASGYLYVTTRRAEKFTRENWERALGIPEGEGRALPHETPFEDHVQMQEETDKPLCDPQACRIIIKGKKISLLRDSYAQPAECFWADILISFEPVRYKPCRSMQVIDKFDQWRKGAHAVFISDTGEILVNTSRTGKELSSRPWSLQRSKARTHKNIRSNNDQEL